MGLDKEFENIKSKEDFVMFLQQLRLNLEARPEEWENVTLADFLESLQAYTEDIEGYYKNRHLTFDKDKPTWRVFAQLLLGAKVYE
ncbi:hypothetical protein FNH22_12740 [Fulvivirga sp. M361]|uniref:DUF7660 family protein n=1 Tax=Fulvivirga sp. M361 TaxID=2594266 RepID=UPI00117A6EDE|nr:hypothetical protein [Fulvivirga sp. M361]TRX58737.1 hypothetical protein FNH22_12740 [Fulvivirga sp. M361]